MMDRARITDPNLARKLKLTPTLAPSPLIQIPER